MGTFAKTRIRTSITGSSNTEPRRTLGSLGSSHCLLCASALTFGETGWSPGHFPLVLEGSVQPFPLSPSSTLRCDGSLSPGIGCHLPCVFWPRSRKMNQHFCISFKKKTLTWAKILLGGSEPLEDRNLSDKNGNVSYSVDNKAAFQSPPARAPWV